MALARRASGSFAPGRFSSDHASSGARYSAARSASVSGIGGVSLRKRVVRAGRLAGGAGTSTDVRSSHVIDAISVLPFGCVRTRCRLHHRGHFRSWGLRRKHRLGGTLVRGVRVRRLGCPGTTSFPLPDGLRPAAGGRSCLGPESDRSEDRRPNRAGWHDLHRRGTEVGELPQLLRRLLREG
jgi:hypothetical protein